jgi:hypothetical protein
MAEVEDMLHEIDKEYVSGPRKRDLPDGVTFPTLTPQQERAARALLERPETRGVSFPPFDDPTHPGDVLIEVTRRCWVTTNGVVLEVRREFPHGNP